MDWLIKKLEKRVSQLESENADLEDEVAKLRLHVETFKNKDKSNEFIKSLTAGYERK